MTISFTKMQGLGNDFVVIDATQSAFSLSENQIARMGDRKYGVGFDQLLVIEPAKKADADFCYRIFNTDGGEVGQCGNGARCVALYIRERGLSHKKKIVLQTQETQILCQVNSNDQVTVQIAAPKFDPADIPFDPNQNSSLDIEFSVVNVGNPHAVVVLPNIESASLSAWGDLLSKDARFPEGVNVSVMSVKSPDHVYLRVYERGVGETQACGSAACASMVLGYQQGLLSNRVRITQPGGDLMIGWQGVGSLIEMTGPAEFVFDGQYFLL